MPSKSQQPREKGKFSFKNSESLGDSGQPPSSLATPTAPSGSSKCVAREASPTCTRSTSHSRSKCAQPLPESSPKQPSGSGSKQLKTPTENLATDSKQPKSNSTVNPKMSEQPAEDPTLPTQSHSQPADNQPQTLVQNLSIPPTIQTCLFPSQPSFEL
jgi:hypothetical protein